MWSKGIEFQQDTGSGSELDVISCTLDGFPPFVPVIVIGMVEHGLPLSVLLQRNDAQILGPIVVNIPIDVVQRVFPALDVLAYAENTKRFSADLHSCFLVTNGALHRSSSNLF